MMKKEDAHKWLLKTVALAEGPANCTNKTVLKGDVFAKVKDVAKVNFGEEITTKKRMTFGDFLQIVEGRITKMEPYKAVIIQKKES